MGTPPFCTDNHITSVVTHFRIGYHGLRQHQPFNRSNLKAKLITSVLYNHGNARFTFQTCYLETISWDFVDVSAWQIWRHYHGYVISSTVEARYQQVQLITKMIRMHLRVVPNYKPKHWVNIESLEVSSLLYWSILRS